MLAIRKQTSMDGRYRYSITLFYLIQFAVTYHSLKGSHLDLSIGVGPVDITLGTTIWSGLFRK